MAPQPPLLKQHLSSGMRALGGWLGVALLLVLLYAAAFVVSETFASPANILLWSVSNAVPHVLCAVPLVDRIAPRLGTLPGERALVLAAFAVSIYAALAYAATIFLLALTARVDVEGMWVRFFSGPALPWQIMQGCAYGAIALLAGLWLDARDALVRVVPAVARPSRWLVKTAEGIVPVDPAEIIRIEAAGEYSRLVLPGREILSRVGMGECADRVRALPFLRVHRSHLVHSDAILRAEGAGNGRLQLALRNGDHVITSREGARLVRAIAV